MKMTKITFFVKDGNYVGFSAVGHTNYAEKGKDIVCAAVSALVQHTARALVSRSKALFKKDDGFMEVNLVQPDQISQVLMEELYKSLLDLQSQFPRNIRLEVKNHENRNTVVRT
ncbi:ribosomal-processing cysteine protease Prp [Pseudothermotoga thermarum]|nr:ribosomal-processing cysteine protease Prp [Pseudothermotoga thermarum]